MSAPTPKYAMKALWRLRNRSALAKLIGSLPNSHAASHQNGGTDEIATETNAPFAIPKAGVGGTLAMGWLDSAVIIQSELTTAIGDLTTQITPQLVTALDPNDQVFRSQLSSGGTATALTAQRAYFIYLGRVTAPIIPKHAALLVTVAGAGTLSHEMGLFSTPLPPNGGNQSVSKIVSSANITAMTSTGLIRNTVDFATSIPAGTHLWAGVRSNMSVTQPAIPTLQYDMGTGSVLVTTGAAALTLAGPWAGTVADAATAFVGPDIICTMF